MHNRVVLLRFEIPQLSRSTLAIAWGSVNDGTQIRRLPSAKDPPSAKAGVRERASEYVCSVEN
jgi:hypothetical protein